MTTRSKIMSGLFLFLGFSLLFVACKKDEASSMLSVSATLSGANEVPPITTTGTGSLTGTYDKDTKVLTYNIQWRVEGTALTGMHFHGPASTTENAGIAIGLTGFSTANNGTFAGATAPLTTQQETDLLAGKWYLNIHSDKARGGEIRGQVIVK